MKIDSHKRDQPIGVEVEQVARPKVEFRHVGQMKRRRGHILFSFNRATGEIKQVTFDKRISLGFDGKARSEAKVTIEANCYYHQSLNEKNFVKHLSKEGLLT